MEPTKRIILNTIVQYSRSLLNIFLSLFSTRYIVEALGKYDYGLYVVVGGVVALLGFITNALIITTQRFVSFFYGKNDLNQVKKIFANSLMLHIIFSLGLTGILLCLKDFFIYDFLSIPNGREDVASKIYFLTTGMLVITILIAPFKALFIARENIVYISIVEICDGFVKLAVALLVLSTDSDRLLLYAFLMLLIQLANLLAFSIYALWKYDECHIIAHRKEIDLQTIRQLMGFAGWSTYGMGAVVLRSQGIQVLLNRSFGTVINSAYGLALQIFGSVSFVATSILNAMNPQIMKAEGEGNRKKMLHLAEMESKYSSMLLILVIIPIIFETPGILSFWLKEVPEETSMFCQFILVSFIIDQLTYGLNTANQSTGKIKLYTLLMYTPKMLVIVPVYFLLSSGHTPTTVMCIYLASEILVSIARLPYIKYTCGLSILHYIKSVFVPLLPLLVVQSLSALLCINNLNFQYRFLVTITVTIMVGMAVIWFFSLGHSEKHFLKSIIQANH